MILILIHSCVVQIEHVFEWRLEHVNTDVEALLAVASLEEAKQVSPLELAIIEKQRKEAFLSYWCTRCPLRLPGYSEERVKTHLGIWFVATLDLHLSGNQLADTLTSHSHGIAEPKATDFRLDESYMHLYSPFYILSEVRKRSKMGTSFKKAKDSLTKNPPRTIKGRLAT